ncbi:hypothetical protein GW746_02440, partial [Candidatus Saccharibacteria bacterium]|nr:hypothetical protein [Candidatus Saccharibacteria bacterium]
IDDIYGAKLQNADRTFKGAISIRTALATSRNIPAVKAMYIAGVQETQQKIRDIGATSYCSVGVDTTAGLASAIGGCGVEQVDLVNAYATFARGGAYKPQSNILEAKNNDGEILKKWSDPESEQVINPQSAYIISDILSDVNASVALGDYAAKHIPGVKTATKTGTSDKGGNAKDLWMMSYSPALTMGVWLGNPDTTILKNGNSSLGSPIVAKVMEYAHKEVYAPEGKWKSGDWFAQPQGIQRVGSEVYPSWWNKTQGQSNETLKFDKLSKKRATDCTPASAIVEFPVIKVTDPVTKKDSYQNVPDGFDWKGNDDLHKCSDAKPTVTNASATSEGEDEWTISVTVQRGTHALSSSNISVVVNGVALSKTCSGSGTITCTATYTGENNPITEHDVTISAEDSALYAVTKTF